MPTNYVRKTKNGKLKMLLFFLFIAFFIWFLTKFSKEFTSTVNATIQYKELPNNTVVSNVNYNEFSFDLTTNGFDILFYKLKKPIININVIKYYRTGDLTVSITNNELINIISSQLKKGKIVKNASINNMVVVLDTITSKKIPIILMSDIDFESGFKPVGSLRIKPDSLIISGPSLILDSIDQVKTKLFKLRNVKNNISKELEIDTFINSNLSYSHKNVLFTSTVVEFTQKKLSLPIKILNLPMETSIKLIPDLLTITFDVSITEFNSIRVNDFEAICDYNKRNTEENFMIPELVIQPERILNVELQEKKVDYLIFK